MLDKIKWFWRYYRRYPYVLAVLLIMTPVQTVFQVSIPRMIDYTIDYLDTGEVSSDWLAGFLVGLGQSVNLSPVAAFGWGFILLGLIASVLYTFVQSHRGWMNLKLEWLFRQDSFNRTTEKGPDFFNKFRTGDLVTRMTDDVAEKLSWFACSGMFRFYEALLMVGFTLVAMMMIDPMLTLWTAGPLPILILIFSRTATILDKRYEYLQTRISNFNDVMEACFSGIRVVKAYVREGAQKQRYSDAAVDRKNAEISTIKTNTVVESLYMYIWQFSILIVLVGGGYLVMTSDLSRGKLGSFVFYVVWLVFPMFDIGQFLVKSRQSAVSINRLMELENMAPMVADNGNMPIVPEIAPDGSTVKRETVGSITFDRVDFQFPESDRKIIDNVSFEIEPGQTVALVGKIGSGKSWLVNMIPRLVDPTGGRITLDGHDLRRFSLEDLRRSIGFVPQEPVLFSDTVRNNILFGRDGISDAELEWAIEVSQLKDEIEAFPKGIETPIGTRGMSISGGQKQRLSLARALVGQPRVLILDDCTSALDSRTEAALWDRLDEVMPQMTAMLVTHRPDTLEQADRILVLEEGSIVESGKHDDLIDAGGTYARIYRRYLLEEAVSDGKAKS